MEKILKNILCFGANSFLAKAFFSAYHKDYNLLPVYRNKEQGLYLDFDSDEKDLSRFIATVPDSINGVIFFQGINPSVGLGEMNFEHFAKMIKVHLSMPAMIIKSLRSKMSPNSSVVFFSSVAKRKGSYDPSYAAAKAGLTGLIYSLANACPDIRFNQLSLGLIEGSPVHLGMTEDFVKRHSEKMFQGRLIKKDNVVRMVHEVLTNDSINRSDLSLEGGYF